MNNRYNVYDVASHTKDKWKLNLEIRDKAQPKKVLWEVAIRSDPYFEACANLTEMRQLYPDAWLENISLVDDTIVIIGTCYVS